MYVGWFAHKGQVYEGQHPSIVPRVLWEQVQQSRGDHQGLLQRGEPLQNLGSAETLEFRSVRGARRALNK
ncbi:MAG TPA: hypothetical protein VFE60_00930 [Roseiarcus sp.]|nr:hypothetical protein [Roseiarcus sp.]